MSARHIGVIMDGNGRWAQQKRRPRIHGHLRGARVAKSIITACADRGVRSLTLYAFSTENWLRPAAEVSFLMRLLGRTLDREANNLVRKNIRFSAIGELHRLPLELLRKIDEVTVRTQNNTGLHLVFAVSYGARTEIVEATRKIAQKIEAGELKSHQIDQAIFAQHLETQKHEDPDLIIRTSGEQRLSNFLLWQAAYSEFYFSDTLWPDFSVQELEQILASYEGRSRRYGQVTNHELAPS